MGSLRKLTREKKKPLMAKARKMAKKIVETDMTARRIASAKQLEVQRQCVAVFNTAAFCVLTGREFKYTARQCSRICARMSSIAECIRLRYVHPFEVLANLRQEVSWTYPRRKVDDMKGKDLTAGGIADDYISREKERAFEQMEIMWLEALRLEEGFARVRMARFIDRVRSAIKRMTVDRAKKVNEWLKTKKIEFVGFDEKIFDEMEKFGVGHKKKEHKK